MTSIFIALLLQTLMMPPRLSLENPAAVSAVPAKLKKDYDKAWTKFVTGGSDPKLVKDLEKLLKKQKNFDAVLTIRAYLDLYAARTAEAEQKFEQVLSREPDNRIAMYYLAEFAFVRGEYARASDLYTRLLETNVSRPELDTKRQKALLLATENLLKSADRAEAQDRFSEAETLYRQALRIAPREPSFHARLADSLAKQKKWDEALTHYRQQAEFGGKTEQTDENIAEALMNLGRTEEAREVLARLRDVGGAREALEAKVRELEDLGRWGDQIDRFRRIEESTSVTRAELSATLVRYFPQITEFRQSPQIVTDIQDSWARSEVQTILGVGLIEKFPNHTFRPEAAITRGELALSLARLMRILGVSPSGAPPVPATDLASTNVLYGDVQFVLGHGLMGLDEAGQFKSDAPVSGAEAVRAIEQLLVLSRGKEA